MLINKSTLIEYLNMQYFGFFSKNDTKSTICNSSIYASVLSAWRRVLNKGSWRTWAEAHKFRVYIKSKQLFIYSKRVYFIVVLYLIISHFCDRSSFGSKRYLKFNEFASEIYFCDCRITGKLLRLQYGALKQLGLIYI